MNSESRFLILGSVLFSILLLWRVERSAAVILILLTLSILIEAARGTRD